MAKRVLISDSLSREGVEVFKQAPGIEVDVMTNLTPDELKGVIKEYDGLVIRSATKVTKEIIDHAENLKVIGRAGSGLDNVDIVAASKRGIVVMNTPVEIRLPRPNMPLPSCFPWPGTFLKRRRL